jgi:hypothetical protein
MFSLYSLNQNSTKHRKSRRATPPLLGSWREAPRDFSPLLSNAFLFIESYGRGSGVGRGLGVGRGRGVGVGGGPVRAQYLPPVLK